jgi:hypothetical protein
MQNIQIKKLADLEKVFGKKLTKTVKGFRKAYMKRTPFSVTLTEVKPSFALGDGDMLRCYAVNLTTGEVIGERYCGSGASEMNHPELFNETAKAPENHALIFVESYASSSNHPWTITVVSPNITKQLG